MLRAMPRSRPSSYLASCLPSTLTPPPAEGSTPRHDGHLLLLPLLRPAPPHHLPPRLLLPRTPTYHQDSSCRGPQPTTKAPPAEDPNLPPRLLLPWTPTYNQDSFCRGPNFKDPPAMDPNLGSSSQGPDFEAPPAVDSSSTASTEIPPTPSILNIFCSACSLPNQGSQEELNGEEEFHKIQPETANDNLCNMNTMQADNGMQRASPNRPCDQSFFSPMGHLIASRLIVILCSLNDSTSLYQKELHILLNNIAHLKYNNFKHS